MFLIGERLYSHPVLFVSWLDSEVKLVCAYERVCFDQFTRNQFTIHNVNFIIFHIPSNTLIIQYLIQKKIAKFVINHLSLTSLLHVLTSSRSSLWRCVQRQRRTANSVKYIIVYSLKQYCQLNSLKMVV